MFAALYALSSLLPVALCALQFQRPEDLPDTNYDFIIAGGGTAGLAVATRLGEIRGINILVIEAGASNDAVFETNIPGVAFDPEFKAQVDGWNYSTTPQVNVNGSVIGYPRAKILGGCSSHNSMVYTRGSQDDYDRWASSIEDENLSWNNLLPYILKAERWSSPNDPNVPETGHFNISNHNTNGILGVSAAYYAHPFNDMLLETTKNMSEEFPFLLDLNDGTPIGIGWAQATIANGTRSSSATRYLPRTGDNVHVLLNTLVTRILPVGNATERDARTVEFATSPDGPRHTLTARREVVLSGGVMNSPQVLLNSGIGPEDELRALGITPFFNNPSVGKNMSDQLAIPLLFPTNLSLTSFNKTAARAQWDRDHTGRFALGDHLATVGWVRIPDNAPPFKNGAPDPTGGINSPHIELWFMSVTDLNEIDPDATIEERDAENRVLFIEVVNLNPVSRGSVTLATTDPFDSPLIDLALLASPLDASITLEGIRSAQRLFSAPAFSESVFDVMIPKSNPTGALTDKDIINYMSFNASHFGHAVGSCSMAPRGADWGVVDPDFNVRGIKGLRIVDASVIPFPPSGHSQVPTYAIAEWASDVIKRSLGIQN